MTRVGSGRDEAFIPREHLTLDCFGLLAVTEEAQCVSSTLNVAINTREQNTLSSRANGAVCDDGQFTF
jgi:hypothetical protein